MSCGFVHVQYVYLHTHRQNLDKFGAFALLCAWQQSVASRQENTAASSHVLQSSGQSSGTLGQSVCHGLGSDRSLTSRKIIDITGILQWFTVERCVKLCKGKSNSHPGGNKLKNVPRGWWPANQGTWFIAWMQWFHWSNFSSVLNFSIFERFPS